MNEEKISDIEVMKGIVSQMTGVPAELLTGDTVAEIKAQADALAEWKDNVHGNENAGDGSGKATRDLFASWLNGESIGHPVPGPDTPSSKYPVIRDGGEPMHAPDLRSTREIFAEYINNSLFGGY